MNSLLQKQIKDRIEYEKNIEDIKLLDLSENQHTNYGYYLFNDLIVCKASSITSIKEFEEQYCLNFVYNNFSKLYNKLLNDSSKNLISLDSMFHINKFKIIQSYESYMSKYKTYLRNLYENFVIFSKNIKIKDFQSFITNFRRYILHTSNIFTFSAFIVSRKCSIYSTGLALKYSDKNNTDILKDPSFEYFNSICNQNNFFIEKNDLSKIVFLLENKEEYIKDYTFIYQNEIYLFIIGLYTIYDYYFNDYLINKIENKKYLTSKQIITLFVEFKLKETNKIYTKTSLDQTLREIYYLLGLKDVTYVTKLIHKLTNDLTVNKDLN